MNTVMTRSRTDSVGGAHARPRSASLSLSGTGYGYDSGLDTDGDYQSAEESAPHQGKSILVPHPGKISVDKFVPSGMENFKNVCELVSEGNQLEDRVRQHFKAQYKDTKASTYNLQSKYYKTELAICKEALNRELQSLAKESEWQKNEKFRLNGILRIIEERETEKIDANTSSRLIMEGFQSLVNFDKEHVDERMIADAIKIHMTQMKQPPLIGKEVMRVNEGKPVKLYVLSPEMIEKLGKLKETYESCVNAQKRYDISCAKYNKAEQQYGKFIEVQNKLTKVQGNIETCSNTSKEIEIVFKNLDAEFKTFMQEQSANEIPVLKSSVSDNRPLMDPVSISEVTDILFKFQKKLRGLVEQRFKV